MLWSPGRQWLFDDDEFPHLKTSLFQQKNGVHAGERLVLNDTNCLVPDTSHNSLIIGKPAYFNPDQSNFR